MALDFSFTPEQEEIRALAHEFAEKEMRPKADYHDEHEETPWEVMRKAHEIGIGPAAMFPTEYGGGGLDRVTELMLSEELSWGDAGMAVAILASGLAGAGIIAMGTEEQKQRYISQLCDSKNLKIAAMGLTEPDSGSDSPPPTATPARRASPASSSRRTTRACARGARSASSGCAPRTPPR